VFVASCAHEDRVRCGDVQQIDDMRRRLRELRELQETEREMLAVAAAASHGNLSSRHHPLRFCSCN
jgi:hypothetical protein